MEPHGERKREDREREVIIPGVHCCPKKDSGTVINMDIEGPFQCHHRFMSRAGKLNLRIGKITALLRIPADGNREFVSLRN